MHLLADLLHSGRAVLQAALLAEAAAAAAAGGRDHFGTSSHQPYSYQQQQQQQGGSSRSTSPGPYSNGFRMGGAHGLRVRTPRSSLQYTTSTTSSSSSAAVAAAAAAQLEQQQEQATQLQLLVAAVHVLAELSHGNHSNQQAAATEGLIDQLTSLAAAATGSRLEVAGQLVGWSVGNIRRSC